jgi:hypothetical protein
MGQSAFREVPLDQQQRAFREAAVQFIADLATGDQGFHPRLRVKRVQGHLGVWEMTWVYDGRATFQYGEEVHAGQQHIIWRRIDTHSIFRRP